MENLPTTKADLIKSFSTSSPSVSPESEISIYKGDVISDENIIRYSVKVRHAFPALPPEYYGVLLDMAKEEGFTDERFRDAVHYVIKTCIYPTPTIAQFISFDKRIQTLNYDKYLKLCDEGLGNNYEPITLKGRPAPVWIHINDINQFNIKSE